MVKTVLEDLLTHILRGKRRPAPTETTTRNSKREALQKLNEEIRELRSSVTDRNVEEKTSEFYTLTKKSLKELLSIKYEATFQEITEEIGKRKKYPPQIQEELEKFLDDVSLMEYGYSHFEELLEEKRREQEKNLEMYIKEIERDGERVGKKTKKQIAAIVSDSVPHSDREFLVRMMDDFKAIAHHLA